MKLTRRVLYCWCHLPLQEDMDSMQKELESWGGENDRHAEALMKEER